MPTVNRVPTADLADIDLQDMVMDALHAIPVCESTDPSTVWRHWIAVKQLTADMVRDFTRHRVRLVRQRMLRLQERLKSLRDQPPTEATAQLTALALATVNRQIAAVEAEQRARLAKFHNMVAGLEIDEDNYTARALSSHKLGGHDRNTTALRHPGTGAMHTTTVGMCDVGRAFFQNLLGPPPAARPSDISNERFPPSLSNRLKVPQLVGLEKPISIDEVEKLISRLNPHRAPGADGVGNDVYKAFKVSLAPHFLPVLQVFQTNPSVPPEVLNAIIAPIYKGKGEREDLKNWRPITLVNTDYKLLALFLANRLNPVMSTLVSPGQYSSVPGRIIFDNIHGVRLAQLLATLQNIDAAFVFIDSEKAFDRVEWAFLWDVLDTMGLPQGFIAMFRALYQGASARVRVNGHLSAPFELTRGVRQGCPVSPLLYVLSLEPLRQYLDARNRAFVSLWLPPDVSPSFAYADDLAIITEASDVDIMIRHIQTYNDQVLYSGQLINFGKSDAEYILVESVPPPGTSIIQSFHWGSHERRHLGIPIGGPNPDASAVAVALERIYAKLHLLAPCNISLLTKVRMLIPRYAGCWQFYAQSTKFEDKIVCRVARDVIVTVYGPRPRPRDIFGMDRLFMPLEMGGSGLIHPPTWLRAFKRDFLVRLHQCLPLPGDEEGLFYSDPSLLLLFKECVRVICGPGAPDAATIFYQPPESPFRRKVFATLPPIWGGLFDHFDAHKEPHTLLAALDASRPLDVVLSAAKCASQLSFEVPLATRLFLAHLSPDSRTSADLLVSQPGYMMRLDPDIPRPKGRKRRVHFHYLSFCGVRLHSHPLQCSPEPEWVASYPSLQGIEEPVVPGLLDPSTRETALKGCRGRKFALVTTHGWMLFQRRLQYRLFPCPWCGLVIPKDQSQRIFLHVSWDCPRFQRHWKNLRGVARVFTVSSIPEIALGHSENAQPVHDGVRTRAVALHAALWRFRSQNCLDYAAILSLYRKLLTVPAHYMHGR